MNKNKITISGASGFVGRSVGRLLARNGFDIVGIVRKGKKKTVNFGQEIISEDLTENDLISSVRGSVAFLHFIGTGKQTTDSDYEKVNVGLTRNALRLCQKAHIKKILYISGLGVNEKSTLGYFISKFKAEQTIIKSGLDYTIFRPSYIIGENDPLSNLLCRQIRDNQITIPGSGNYRVQPILVSDVARVVMKAILERKFSRKIIDLVGPQKITYNRFVRDLVGKRSIKIKNVDFEQTYNDALQGKGNQFGVDELGILVGDYIGNHKKLAKISRMEFTKYDKMLKSCRLS
jgi:NADH dehydrogenase